MKPPSKRRVIKTLQLAIRIADRAARSDIQCFAKSECIELVDGERVSCYDLTMNAQDGSAEEKASDLRVVSEAAAYVELRGDGLPYQMLREEDRWQVVRFVDREEA